MLWHTYAVTIESEISKDNKTSFMFVHLPANTTNCAVNLMAGTIVFSRQKGSSEDMSLQHWAIEAARDTEVDVANFLIINSGYGFKAALEARENYTLSSLAEAELMEIGSQGDLYGVVGCENYVDKWSLHELIIAHKLDSSHTDIECLPFYDSVNIDIAIKLALENYESSCHLDRHTTEDTALLVIPVDVQQYF